MKLPNLTYQINILSCGHVQMLKSRQWSKCKHMIRVSILWQEVVVKLMNSKSVLSHFINNLDKMDYEFWMDLNF